MEERLGISTNGEQNILFNLMAVVPDRRIAITNKLNMLRTNKTIVSAALETLMTAKSPHLLPSTSNADVKKEQPSESDTDTVVSTTSAETSLKKPTDNVKKESDGQDADADVKRESKDSSDITILQQLSLHNDSTV